jgi:transcriptional regulator with XRE-family HTH domain
MLVGGILTTVGALPSLQDVRRRLRAERRARELTLDALSEKSGVDRAAIHKIENVAKYPTYEPGLDTFTRLVEAMPGLTLALFFAHMEHGIGPAEIGARAPGVSSVEALLREPPLPTRTPAPQSSAGPTHARTQATRTKSGSVLHRPPGRRKTGT